MVTLTLGHSQDMSFGSQLEARSASSDQKSRCITNLLESLVSKNPETKCNRRNKYLRNKNLEDWHCLPLVETSEPCFEGFNRHILFGELTNAVFLASLQKVPSIDAREPLDGGFGGRKQRLELQQFLGHLLFFFSTSKVKHLTFLLPWLIFHTSLQPLRCRFCMAFVPFCWVADFTTSLASGSHLLEVDVGEICALNSECGS